MKFAFRIIIKCYRPLHFDVLFQGMMMVTYGLCVLLVVTIPVHITAFKSGAPESVCDSMTPEHHSTPQTGPSPYTITPSKLKIKPGESVQVTLSGTDNTKFRGYFIQARVGNTPIGKFENGPEINLINCGSVVGVRITYKSSHFPSMLGYLLSL
jgi:hypothetical protein